MINVKIPIRNKTSETLRVMIEPSAEVYDIPPDFEAEIHGDDLLSSKGIEIEVWDENFISVWVPSKVDMFLLGNKLEPLKES